MRLIFYEGPPEFLIRVCAPIWVIHSSLHSNGLIASRLYKTLLVSQHLSMVSRWLAKQCCLCSAVSYLCMSPLAFHKPLQCYQLSVNHLSTDFQGYILDEMNFHPYPVPCSKYHLDFRTFFRLLHVFESDLDTESDTSPNWMMTAGTPCFKSQNRLQFCQISRYPCSLNLEDQTHLLDIAPISVWSRMVLLVSGILNALPYVPMQVKAVTVALNSKSLTNQKVFEFQTSVQDVITILDQAGMNIPLLKKGKERIRLSQAQSQWCHTEKTAGDTAIRTGTSHLESSMVLSWTPSSNMTCI